MDFTAAGSPTEPLCPLCSAAAGQIRYDYGKLKIIRCHGCGLWRTCPRLSPEELTAYYRQHHYSDELQRAGQYDEWRRRNADVWEVNARLVAREWHAVGQTFLSATSSADRQECLSHQQAGMPVPPPAPTLLDVGCGHGFFLEHCRALGIQARGIDTSPQAVTYARDELKQDVREMTLEQLPAGERYDIITLWGVLEHVPQPLRTMEQVRAHLQPGGMTWVMTPNTNALERFLKGSQYFNFLNQSHLTHFHRATLRALLQRAGFVNARRYIHWGGGRRRGPSALAQYAARRLCLGTELRFVAEAPA